LGEIEVDGPDHQESRRSGRFGCTPARGPDFDGVELRFDEIGRTSSSRENTNVAL
jgi:hypothetical protein